MSHSSFSLKRIGTSGLVLLVVMLGYSLISSIIYVLWSKFVGWPTQLSSEILLRLIHLIPAMICAGLAAMVAGRVVVTRNALIPAALLGLFVGFTHYASYYNIRLASAEYKRAAAAEALLLLAETVALSVVAAKRSASKRP